MATCQIVGWHKGWFSSEPDVEKSLQSSVTMDASDYNSLFLFACQKLQDAKNTCATQQDLRVIQADLKSWSERIEQMQDTLTKSQLEGDEQIIAGVGNTTK